MHSPFEAGMLLCFGFSWPFSIWKLWRTKQAAGVSLRFLAMVELGYVCGLLHKIFYSWDGVFWLYLLNFLMVATAMSLSAMYRYNNRSSHRFTQLDEARGTVCDE